MKTKADLESILSELDSDIARSNAISQLVGKVDLSPQHIERAIEVYEEAGMFWDAAKIALKAGLTKKAERLSALVDLVKS